MRMPWGADLRIKLPELISNSIWIKGVYDIVVAETIWRLIDAGDIVLDVGANFGYLTSLMAVRAGKDGKVLAFEPHPMMFEELKTNIELWSNGSSTASIEARQTALSSANGVGNLVMPPSWEGNRGAAFVSTDAVSENSVEIILERLDDVFDDDITINLAKFDVEGHEFEAFRGAERLLAAGTIRNIVFEDQRNTDSPAKAELLRHGYRLFSLAKRFRGPRLCNVDGSGTSPRDDPNFLATLDPDQAIARMKGRGWNIFREE